MKPKIPGLQQQAKIKTTPSLEVTNLNAYHYQATKSNSEAVQGSISPLLPLLLVCPSSSGLFWTQLAFVDEGLIVQDMLLDFP